MLELAHALTGAAIAAKVQNPWLSLPISFFSHFLMDLLPHWNPNLRMTKKKHGLFYLPPKIVLFIVADSLAGLFLGLSFARHALPNLNRAGVVVAGAFLAVLPDLAEAPYLFLGIKNRWINKLFAFQKSHQFKVSFWPGMLFQTAYLLLLLFLIR